MTSRQFRSALRASILGTIRDWTGATRCRLFGHHVWRAVSLVDKGCGGADVVIVCPRCDEIAVAMHVCDATDHGGGGEGLPKPAIEHLKDATQPSPEMTV